MSQGSAMAAPEAAWLRDGGVAVENNYLCITIGGHLQQHFTVPTAAVTGGLGMQNTPSQPKPANQGASELSTPATLRLPVQSFL